jgi:hypothetical protein
MPGRRRSSWVPVDSALLDAWRDGGFGERVTAAFRLLDRPDAAGVAGARQAGLTDAGIRDALHVQFVFNVINRLANSFGYGWATEADKVAGIRVLHRLGYRLPRFLPG